MSSTKIDHKELQKRLHDDEVSVQLAEAIQGTRSFFSEHGRTILYTVVLIAIVALSIYLWKQKARADSAAVQTAFGNASAYVQEEEYEQALQELGKLISDYSNSPIVPAAHLLRGDCYVRTGQYDLAKAEYEAALPNLSGNDKLVAEVALVQTYRSLGTPDQALALLDQMEQQAQTDELKDQIHYLRGGCYEDKKQNEQAMKEYNAIDSESSWYPLVQERMRWLNAPVVDAIN